LGLGTCYVDLITKALKNDRRFRQKLGITPPFEIVTTLAMGYPLGRIDGIISREQPRIDWIT